jgi:thiamine-monophosphate kinase
VISSESKGREGVMTVADLGEFALIAAIQERLPPDPAAIVGIGDDAAVLPAPDGRVVATTDLLVEGRHFRRDWSTAADIGAKAAAQNLADVAAMGAVPTALLLGLALPAELSVDWVLDVASGLAAESGRAGAYVVGGDITSADAVMLAITALGDLNGASPVTRAGARPGDVIALSAPVGASAAGLALLAAGWIGDVPAAGNASDAPASAVPVSAAPVSAAPGSPASWSPAALIAAHRRPQPDYGAGPIAAAAGATSMIDISDGLLADLGHIAEASGVGMDVGSANLPGTAPLVAAAAELGTDWRQWALAGGEDHVLAATFPERASVPATWTVIGTVLTGTEVLVDSARWRGPGGWAHFRSGERKASS